MKRVIMVTFGFTFYFPKMFDLFDLFFFFIFYTLKVLTLSGLDPGNVDLTQTYCPALNVSQCLVNKFVLFVSISTTVPVEFVLFVSISTTVPVESTSPSYFYQYHLSS